jgi:hypothetical protein
MLAGMITRIRLFYGTRQEKSDLQIQFSWGYRAGGTCRSEVRT